MIKDRIARVHEQIAQVCRRIGRNPEEITLVGVTKFAPVEKIQEAVACGIRHVAENKVQEGEKKFPSLHGVTKHMIGHLQTNKVKAALQFFDIIQSVDSLKLAQVIDKHAVNRIKPTEIFIQVNISGEEQKYGVDRESAQQLIRDIVALKNLKVRGLMTMAPFTEDKNIVRNCFRGLRELRDELVKDFSSVDWHYLSMGMSQDYEIALEEGSNMLRIGTAIFGEEK